MPTRSAAPGNVLTPAVPAEAVPLPVPAAVVLAPKRLLTLLTRVVSPGPKLKASPVEVGARVTVLAHDPVPVAYVPLGPVEPHEPVCDAGGPRMMLLPVGVAVMVDLMELVSEDPLPDRTENWVEYWNSPVPSTMINRPYPVSVFCVPGARSLGTDHSNDFCEAGMPSAMAVSAVTQFLEEPWQRTILTVTPSVGWDSGSQVISKG